MLSTIERNLPQQQAIESIGHGVRSENCDPTKKSSSSRPKTGIKFGVYKIGGSSSKTSSSKSSSSKSSSALSKESKKSEGKKHPSKHNTSLNDSENYNPQTGHQLQIPRARQAFCSSNILGTVEENTIEGRAQVVEETSLAKAPSSLKLTTQDSDDKPGLITLLTRAMEQIKIDKAQKTVGQHFDDIQELTCGIRAQENWSSVKHDVIKRMKKGNWLREAKLEQEESNYDFANSQSYGSLKPDSKLASINFPTSTIPAKKSNQTLKYNKRKLRDSEGSNKQVQFYPRIPVGEQDQQCQYYFNLKSPSERRLTQKVSADVVATISSPQNHGARRQYTSKVVTCNFDMATDEEEKCEGFPSSVGSTNDNSERRLQINSLIQYAESGDVQSDDIYSFSLAESSSASSQDGQHSAESSPKQTEQAQRSKQSSEQTRIDLKSQINKFLI